MIDDNQWDDVISEAKHLFRRYVNKLLARNELVSSGTLVEFIDGSSPRYMPKALRWHKNSTR